MTLAGRYLNLLSTLSSQEVLAKLEYQTVTSHYIQTLQLHSTAENDLVAEKAKYEKLKEDLENCKRLKGFKGKMLLKKKKMIRDYSNVIQQWENLIKKSEAAVANYERLIGEYQDAIVKCKANLQEFDSLIRKIVGKLEVLFWVNLYQNFEDDTDSSGIQ